MGEGVQGDGTRGEGRTSAQQASGGSLSARSVAPRSFAPASFAPRSSAPGWLALVAILAAAGYYFRPVAACLERCFVDLQALKTHPIVEVQTSDMRLNSWILGWVQRSLLDPTLSLFNSNTLHPGRDALTGSEHMLGVALQTLPVRWLSEEAVALHQVALILSTLVLAGTSFALVRWATGSVWAAAVTGMATMFAPWRITELPHLQLLSVQWIPLVWLLVTRIALGEAGARAAALLALVLGLQLLSSYYLAYFTTLSIAVLLGLLFLRGRIAWSSVVQLLAAASIPYAALAWLSRPYLVRDSAVELVPGQLIYASSTLGQAWASVAPVVRVSLGEPSGVLGYAVPASVFILAVVALAALFERRPGGSFAVPASERVARGGETRSGDDSHLPRVKALCLALWGVVLAAFVLSLGRKIWLAGEMWPLPGSWLAALVPGFSVLRGPLRWLILVGVASPVLAGLGVWVFERWLTGGGTRTRTGLVVISRVFITIALVATLPWRPLPVRAAMPARQRVESAYQALALLPPGPMVEIPWPMNMLDDVVLSSRHTLASTLHWRPMLNGFTAYRPPAYTLLRRIAQELPRPKAVRQLRSLSGLRFIMVHLNRLKPSSVRSWLDVAGGGLLREVYADSNIRIYQVEASDGSPSWSDALVSPEPRALTLAGLSRAELSLERPDGAFEVRAPREFRAFARDRNLLRVLVTVQNGSEVDWPGLDVQREGLVELRYRFSPLGAGGGAVIEASAALDIDMPAGRHSVTRAHLRTPDEAGDYFLSFDLVQRLGDALVPLPFGTQTLGVRVLP